MSRQEKRADGRAERPTEGVHAACGRAWAEHPRLATLDDLPATSAPGESDGTFGRTRFGKSALAKERVERWRKARRAHLVFDVQDEATPFGRPRKDCQLGNVAVRMTVSDFVAQCERDPGFFFDDRLSLAVVPDLRGLDGLDGEYLAEELHRVVKELVARQVATETSPIEVVLEEVNLYAKPAARLFYKLVAGLGKEGISTHLVGQRWGGIEHDTRTQFSRVITCRQTEKYDLRELTHQLGKAFACTVATLPKRAFVIGELSEAAPDALDGL
jgi:hypothetical protein